MGLRHLLHYFLVFPVQRRRRKQSLRDTGKKCMKLRSRRREQGSDTNRSHHRICGLGKFLVSIFNTNPYRPLL
jgi:hypothetical protein